MFHYLDFHHICFTWTNFTQNKVQIFEALKVWVFFLLATQTHISFPTTKTQTTPNNATKNHFWKKPVEINHHFLKLTPEIYFCTYIPSPQTYVQWKFYMHEKEKTSFHWDILPQFQRMLFEIAKFLL
jgi:hypothetical protein